MAGKVSHFEIHGKNGKKSQEFYASLFGWKVDANNPMNYGMVPGMDGGIGGGVREVQPGGAPMVTLFGSLVSSSIVMCSNPPRIPNHAL